MTKLPVAVETFAQKYFAAEARGLPRRGFGTTFRTKDKLILAAECKALLDSGAVDTLNQLSQDLEDYTDGDGHPRVTHTYRLNAFAKLAGIEYPMRPMERSAATPAVVHRAPTHYAVPTQGIRAELAESFAKWLSSGMSLSALQAEAQEALVASNHKVQVGKVTTSLQDLMRTTGMTPGQLADIARSL